MINFLLTTLVLVRAAFGCRSDRIVTNGIKANVVEPTADAGFIKHPEVWTKRVALAFQKVWVKPGFDKVRYCVSIIAQIAKHACLMLRSMKWSRSSSIATGKRTSGCLLGPSMFKYGRFQRLIAGFLSPVMISACTVIDDGTDRWSPEQPDKPLTGVVWKLLRFDTSANQESFSINAPDRYTLTLLSDGSYRVKADCNRMQGAYQLDYERIRIHPGAATLAECGPDSKYAHYLRYLITAKDFEIDEARHQFTLSTDTGRLVFERGTETP